METAIKEKSKMPLLDKCLSNGQKHDDIALLVINHDLGDCYDFAEKLSSAFYKVIFVGASYRNSRLSERQLFHGIYYHAERDESGGFIICRCENRMKISSPDFINAMDMLIMLALSSEIVPLAKQGKKIIIIEDGGYHSDVIDNLQELFPGLVESILGSVEQTTSGTKIANVRTGFHYPIVSVARSDIKMNFESIFIGQSIVIELGVMLFSAENFFDFNRVILFGYGIVGRSVARYLKPYRCKITVFDVDGRIRDTAAADGLEVTASLRAEHFDRDTIIIGCTGNRSFQLSMLDEFMNGAAGTLYLASASSKDVEFKEFKELAENGFGHSGIQIEQIKKETYFQQYRLSRGTAVKELFLFADGMPVNFYREDSINLTYKVVDIVFSEMYCCAEAIIKMKLEKKLHILGSQDLQGRIVDEEKLLQDWFQINSIPLPENINTYLDAHPDWEYLRERIFEKNENRHWQ